MKYPQVYEGEWVRPIKKGYKMQCCDCGLVHKVDFKISGRHVLLRAFRDERATAAVRRGKQSKAKIKKLK